MNVSSPAKINLVPSLVGNVIIMCSCQMSCAKSKEMFIDRLFLLLPPPHLSSLPIIYFKTPKLVYMHITGCHKSSCCVVYDEYYVTFKTITLMCISFMFIEMKFIHCHSYVMFAMKSMNICNDLVNYDEIIIPWSLVFKYMFQIFILVWYLRRTLNYLERISSSNHTHMMIMIIHVAINVETLRIVCRCSLEKDFTQLIYI